jgi:ferrochelatase
MVHTRAQTDGIRERLNRDGDLIPVEFGMRYGNPRIADGLDKLARTGVQRILVLAMYPQYSTTTIATVEDVVERYRDENPVGPRVSVLPGFPGDQGYIEAMAGVIERFWEAHGRPDFAAGQKLLLSFHGIPESLTRGKNPDPYPQHCAITTVALRQRLGLTEAECLQTFQSKFGPGRWLTPATIDTVGQLGAQATSRLDVFCPGFASDCLETDEEINQLNRAEFTNSGGGEFNKIPCLNDDPAWLDALASLVLQAIDDDDAAAVGRSAADE